MNLSQAGNNVGPAELALIISRKTMKREMIGEEGLVPAPLGVPRMNHRL